MKPLERILIIRLDKIGDLLLSYPVINTLRLNYPRALISGLVTPYTQSLAEGSGWFDEVFLYDSNWKPEPKRETIARLRCHNFDAVIALSPTYASYLLAYQTKAKLRLGNVYSKRWLIRAATNWLLTHKNLLPIEESLSSGKPIPHEVLQGLDLLKFLEITNVNDNLSLQLPEAIKPLDALAHKGQKFIGIQLSLMWFKEGWSLNDLKSWLLQMLDKFPGYNLVVFYGAQESFTGQGLASIVASTEKIKFLGEASFWEWAAAIQQCQVVITPDTGATHLAAALKVPVICLYAPATFKLCSQQWHPWQVLHENLKFGPPEVIKNEIMKALQKLLP